MRELLSGRRHLARVRYAAYALAVIGVWAGATSDSGHGPMAWTAAVCAVLLLPLLLLVNVRSHLAVGLLLSIDQGMMVWSCWLAEADLFWLLLFPVVCAVRLAAPIVAGVLLMAGAGGYALVGVLRPGGELQPWDLLLRAGALAVGAGAAWALTLSERAARPHWETIRDLAPPAGSNETASRVRFMAQALGRLLQAEHVLLFVRRDQGRYAHHDPLLALTDRQTDAAATLSDSELVRSTARALRPVLLARPRRDPRLPRTFLATFRPDSIVAIPLGNEEPPEAVVLLVNKTAADGFTEADAGLAQLLGASDRRALPSGTDGPKGLPSPAALEAAPVELLSQCREGVAVVDEDGTIVGCNPRFCELLDLPTAPLSRPFPEAVDDVALSEAVVRTLDEGVSVDESWRPEDAARPEMGLRTRAIMRDGRQAGALLLLAPRRDAEAVTEACHRVLSSVSHELRTPLTAIKASASTLLNIETVEDDTRDQFLKEIVAQADRLADSVDELIECAEGPALEAPAPEAEPVVLSTAVTEILEGLAAIAGTRRIQTSFPDDEAPVLLPVARGLHALRQMLRDAVTRAAPGSAVLLSEAQDPERAHLSVTFVPDEGVGVEPCLASAAFATVGAGARPGGGLGLGLYLVQRTAVRWGGTVTTEAVEDGRVRWTLSLPVAREDLGARNHQSEPTPGNGSV